ncbi:MAG: PspA/IM30 family protein [Chloroflexota bacterium]|nr:PspA/IM30 family protein [Chloroflexota bacterium]
MAGIFDRMSTILRANINSMLDKAEDPEVMIDQIIRDMASAIAEARGQVADMIAQEKILQANVERNQQLSNEWQQKATLAVQRGRDDLAREALRRKTDYDDNVRVYGQQLQSQSQMVDKLKSELQQLESKYEDARRNREVLLARHRRAQTQEKVAQVSAQLNTMDPSAELGRMEERIRLAEARAEAQAELADESMDDQFAALSADSEVESQLAALKSQLGAGEQSALPSGEES